MAEFTKEKIKYFLLLSIGLLFANCANQLPPGGGDVDRIPPTIEDVYPPDGTTNFNDDHIEITFSEYVEKRTAKDAIFISPAIEGDLEYDWSGKTLEINFPHNLPKNKTYVITVGTDVVDYNNKNRLAEAFNFSFSTGNEIDRRMISGKVYADKPEGVLLFAYLVGEDTINPSAKKPDYVSQSGNDGSYKLAGLSAGRYRVFAVKDEYRDLLYQPVQDEYGAPYQEISFSENDSSFAGLDYFLTKIDTTAPRLVSASMTDKYHVLLNFTEKIDSTLISSKNFYIYDSTKSQKYSPLYAFKGNTKSAEIVLSLNDTLSAADDIFLFADTTRDKSGNFYLKDFARINVSSKPDTVKPSIFKLIPANRSQDADYLNQKFYFYFDDGFDTSAAKTGISFTDTSGNKIQFNSKFLDDASFYISNTKNLEPRRDYIINLDLSKFEDAAGNKYDSLFQYKFKTISGIDFTGVSGTVTSNNLLDNPILVLQNMDKKESVYKQKITDNGKFKFNRVEAGKYRLWAFLDKDSSGTYSYGLPFPFKPSERFNFYPDTLTLKPRWTLTDVKFNFGQNK